MDSGSEIWLVLALLLPLLAIVLVFLLKRVKLSKSANIVLSVIGIALFAAYWIWTLFFR